VSAFPSGFVLALAYLI